jgi:ABC-type Fe3+-siderophore transport system permease subunit
MKITNWCRKLSVALMAGGLMAPSLAQAADLNTNLLANPGFESVNDTGTLGAYNTPMINNWTPVTPDKQGFAYSHNGSLSNGNVVPNYANGAPLASGGNWYFTPNSGPNNAVINGPGQFFQDIDVSAGASGALIAGGSAVYNISAFFNSFQDQGDIGHLHLDFRNNAMASIGTAEVAGVLPLNEWTQNSSVGQIPVGTHTVRVSIFGTTPVAGGPDGYMDNVVFSIRIPEPSTIALAGMGLAAAGLSIARRRRDE